jgi:hypothetical protein
MYFSFRPYMFYRVPCLYILLGLIAERFLDDKLAFIVIKSKAVPLHAMEVVGGERV